MSDGEQPAAEVVAVEEAVEEEQPAAEEQPALQLPKERVRKPSRPDDTELKAQTEVLNAQIQKAKARIAQIGETIEARKSGRGEGSKEQQAVRNKLADLRAQFQAALSQKQAVRGQLDAARKTRENVRASLRDLKSNMKFTTVEQIDEAIARLEERVNHSTLSLNEEKRILEDIKKLKQSRASVGQYSDKLSQLAQDESATDDLVGRLKQLDEQLNGIKAQEEELRGQLAEIREREQEKSSDIPALIQERDECREICKQAYEKIKELRAEHSAKWDQYKEQQQLWWLQSQEDRKRKQEQYLAERARRDAERAARMAELAGEPFDKEVTMCEQVLNYLAKFVASEAAVAEEKKADVAHLEGFKVMQKKEATDDDAWIMGVGKKAGKGGKGKGGKKEEGGARKAAAGGDEKLSHSLDILEAFTTLKLEVPLSKSKVPGVLEAVKAKKEHFLQRREEVKANGAPATEPLEPQPEGEAEAAGEGAAEGGKAGEGGRKGGKGKTNGRVELNLDDESWPSVSGEPAPAKAPAAPAGGETKWGSDESGGAAAAQVPAAGVSVSLTVSEEGAVSLAITAH